MQARHAPPPVAVEVVERLSRHADFDMGNLNRFRALFGSFATNSAGFHHRSGKGYELMAEWLLRLDALEPADGGADAGASSRRGAATMPAGRSR